jgi:predicted nucleotidyltransferase
MHLPKYQFLKELQKFPFVEQIWLYGSWATGDACPNSDIDLAIFCPQASRLNWQEIKNLVFDADTLRGVDCIRLDTLKEGSFKENIILEKKLLYQRTNLEQK